MSARWVGRRLTERLIYAAMWTLLFATWAAAAQGRL